MWLIGSRQTRATTRRRSSCGVPLRSSITTQTCRRPRSTSFRNFHSCTSTRGTRPARANTRNGAGTRVAQNTGDDSWLISSSRSRRTSSIRHRQALGAGRTSRSTTIQRWLDSFTGNTRESQPLKAYTFFGATTAGLRTKWLEDDENLIRHRPAEAVSHQQPDGVIPVSPANLLPRGFRSR